MGDLNKVWVVVLDDTESSVICGVFRNEGPARAHANAENRRTGTVNYEVEEWPVV